MRSRVVILGILGAAAIAVAAPIRVGSFSGLGPGRYWHDMIHTASTSIGNMLAIPDTANLGPSLVIHPNGFRYDRYGLKQGSGTPSPEQKAAFLAALDSLDVVVFITNTDIGGIFPDSASRARIERFWRGKGVVSVHGGTDSYGRWPEWDRLHGTRFLGHPSSDRSATVKLDAAAHQDSSWTFLNRSLFDTSFVEEWHFFTTSGDSIRSVPGLKITVNLDESTLTGGFGGRTPMGDHPMSWYRELPEGGRFFYTAMGHRPNLWSFNTNQPRFVRRQVYNAILWAAGADSTGAVSVRGRPPVREFSDAARISFIGSSLSVSVQRDGAHWVEIRSLGGGMVAKRSGQGRVVHEFPRLRPGAVYAVSVTSGGRRVARLVTTP